MDSFFVEFDDLEDPRVERTKLYSVAEILVLVLSASMCGIESWRGAEEFGEDRIDSLRKYLPYENGVPSHQTIGRVMSLLKPQAVTKAFTQVISRVFGCSENEIIAIDGKTLRHSFDKASKQAPIHVLNAYAVKSGLCLSQLKVDGKTNEITTVPDILDLLDIRHATVTVDALNTQKEIASKIISKGGDYVLPVKENHKQLLEDIELNFDTQPIAEGCSFQTVNKGHGRVEVRSFSIMRADILEQKKEWSHLECIGKVVRETYREGKDTYEKQYYLLSYGDVKRFAEASRGHWGVENSVHWVLDVTFREDDCRVRKDHAPENFSIVRKMALNILRQDKGNKMSIPRKQARASRIPEYFENLLSLLSGIKT